MKEVTNLLPSNNITNNIKHCMEASLNYSKKVCFFLFKVEMK